jgi:hypothetical protein
MSSYIMLPGARLEIGPHGRPEESLGACCSACASGASKCMGGGAPGSKSLGDVGDLGKPLLLLGVAAVGAAVLFPKAWKRFTKSLWG